MGPEDFEYTAAPRATSRPPPPSPQPPPPPPPPPPQGPAWAPGASLACGIAAWVMVLLAAMGATPAWMLSIPLGVCAIAFGVLGRRAGPGAPMGQGAALAGLILGIVHLGFGVLLPLLAILVCCMACGGTTSSGSSSSGGSSCCWDCDCGGCDPQGCDCGGACAGCDTCDCGDCCGDCGGCTCATAGAAGLAGAAQHHVPLTPFLSRLDRWLAHHPRRPEYREDVLTARGVRFCIGCFVTYPVFLVAAVLPLALSWSVSIAVGAALALVQVVSMLGRAKRRWQKVIVKSALGLGMALVLRGVLLSPWSETTQTLVLWLVALAGMASAIPRARRMRRAARCAACGEAQSETSTP